MQRKNIFIISVILLSTTQLFGGWQQSKNHWPRLTFEKQDIAIIRSHYEAAQQGKEPYKTLWTRIQKSGSMTAKIGNKEWGPQNANAGIAKSKALIYLLTGDKQKANEARDILSNMYTGEEIPKFGVRSLTFKLTPDRKSTRLNSSHYS